jgi:hypothetical protein
MNIFDCCRLREGHDFGTIYESLLGVVDDCFTFDKDNVFSFTYFPLNSIHTNNSLILDPINKKIFTSDVFYRTNLITSTHIIVRHRFLRQPIYSIYQSFLQHATHKQYENFFDNFYTYMYLPILSAFEFILDNDNTQYISEIPLIHLQQFGIHTNNIIYENPNNIDELVSHTDD